MMTEDDDLVDLSVSASSTTPAHATVSLVRSSIDEKWGFLLFNNRFPLMVGRVDASKAIAESLIKGDVITAINGVTMSSFDAAVQLMHHAKLQLSLTIDLASAARTCKTPAAGGGPSKSIRPDDASPLPLADGESPTAVGETSSPYAATAPHGWDAGPFGEPPKKVLRVDPITITPSRSNVDVVLARLPKPPRIATYNRHECPFGQEQGFTDSFHNFVQDFIADQALGSATPNNDLRFDAISAVMKSGIARLPNELIRDITQRGGDVLRRQEANLHSGVERDRFFTQVNAMNTIILDKKRAHYEAKTAALQKAQTEAGRLREAMQLYQRMCGDCDDQVFISPSAASSARSDQPHTDSLPLPPPPGMMSTAAINGNVHLQQLVNRAIASLPPAPHQAYTGLLPTPPSAFGKPQPNSAAPMMSSTELESLSANVTVHIPLSRKQRKKLRQQQQKEQVESKHADLLAPAPLAAASDLPVPHVPFGGSPWFQEASTPLPPPNTERNASDLPLPPQTGVSS
jgi:hypothetical protein